MKMSKERLRYLIDNWESKTIKEIAEYCGTADNTIYKWAKELRAEGVVLPERTARNERKTSGTREVLNSVINMQ